MNIIFKSPEHRTRFLKSMHHLGKIETGWFDPEYGAALYILTAHTSLWQKAQHYISPYGIDIESMLRKVDFSSGYRYLVELAGNLFNGTIQSSPVDWVTLTDEENFKVAISALFLRRERAHINDFGTE